MKSRTPAPARQASPDRSDDPTRLTVAGDRVGWAEVPVRVRAALGLAAAAAVLQSLGWLLGPVADAPPPGFASLPLLVVLALLPPVLAAVAFARGRPLFGASVLVGAAVLLPGRFLLDAQFLADPLYTSRPEVTLLDSLAPLAAGPGLWPLLLGHVLGAAAGLLALGRRAAEVGTPYAAEFDDPSDERSQALRRRSMATALVLGGFAGAALLMRPFTSDNAFQLADSASTAPLVARFGLILLGLLVPLGAVSAASSACRSVSTGALVGLFAGVAAVTVPHIASGLLADGLHPAPGPVIALVAMLAAPRAVWAYETAEQLLRGRLAAWRGTPESGGRGLHLAAAVAGLATTAFALVAYLGRQLVLPEGLPEPVEYSSVLFLPGAVVVGVLSLALAVPAFAAAARPAFVVALAVTALAGAAALDAVVTATDASPLVSTGNGVWGAGFAIGTALLAAVLAAVAGSAERDDSEDADPAAREANTRLAAPVAAAVLFAVGAFGLPALRAPDFVSPGIWTDFRITSLGLLAALLAVVGAAALALFSRPARAAALLLGAALLVGVRALEYPLTAARAEGASPGPGTWLALATAAALLVSAAVAASARPRRQR